MFCVSASEWIRGRPVSKLLFLFVEKGAKGKREHDEDAILGY